MLSGNDMKKSARFQKNIHLNEKMKVKTFTSNSWLPIHLYIQRSTLSPLYNKRKILDSVFLQK